MGSNPAASLSNCIVRRATPDDAQAIHGILAAVTAERVFSAITEPWPVEAQRRYLAGLSAREVFHLAIDPETGSAVGYQSLDLWSPTLPAMAHVGQVGTFLLPGWRGRGVGRALFAATAAHARAHGFLKFVIQVRGSNGRAQRFYSALGFTPCGRLARQIQLADGSEDDEVILEFFL